MATLPPDAVEKIRAEMPSWTPEKLIKFFLRLRETKSALTRAYDAEVDQIDMLAKLSENLLLRAADQAGVTGFTTDAGTTYMGEKVSISIADAEAFYDFVRRENDLDFFERRVSSRHVEDYMKQHEGSQPPGLNIFRERVTRVRKKSEK